MNKLIYTPLLLAIFMAGCSSNDEPTAEPQEAEITLSYQFAESGQMSRSAGSEAYSKFYDSEIASKQLTPRNYSLTFTEKTTGAKYEYSGRWSDGKKMSILEGSYTVEGESAPVSTTIDTLSLKFGEDVVITKDTKDVVLNAQYNSFLLLLNAQAMTSAEYRYSTSVNTFRGIKLRNAAGLYYMFVKTYFSHDENEGQDMIVTRQDNGGGETIYLNELSFEIGKYYYFNEVTNSFNIPAMEAGN